MRFLFTTQPGHGHFSPLVSLARAAGRAGHEVTFATSTSFGPTVEKAGFASLPAGLDWLEADIERSFPEITATTGMTVRQQVSWWLNNVWGDGVPRAMADDLLGIIRRWGPDVVVHEQWELGAPLAAELLGVPYAMQAQGLLMPAARWKTLAGATLAQLRESVGLPADPELSWLHRHCYLDSIPPSFQIPYDLPVAYRYRPVSPDRRAELSPTGVGEVPGRPTVYASMGTVFNRVGHVFEAILRGLRDEPVNLILVVGDSVDPAPFGPQPDHVRVERFVPQTAVLARCDAVITHGGYNTVGEALAEGLPMLTIPLGVDQPINAERCLALGVGLRLLPEEVTAGAVRAAVRQLLDDPGYRSNAQRIRREIESMPAIEGAVEQLEKLASG